ncbi:hypothetical protein FA13DRAFT_1455575 [Coprinellus micaceus]|uniref:Uncharacterized protein n=1 Tax=Coprinellus micaceus TaxID=71717 RepID=A0A4Y7SML9_COPMI|nr:hypothetical protein FA13DRAFT_1455575 [Coprinellus micaceus]
MGDTHLETLPGPVRYGISADGLGVVSDFGLLLPLAALLYVDLSLSYQHRPWRYTRSDVAAGSPLLDSTRRFKPLLDSSPSAHRHSQTLRPRNAVPHSKWRSFSHSPNPAYLHEPVQQRCLLFSAARIRCVPGRTSTLLPHSNPPPVSSSASKATTFNHCPPRNVAALLPSISSISARRSVILPSLSLISSVRHDPQASTVFHPLSCARLRIRRWNAGTIVPVPRPSCAVTCRCSQPYLPPSSLTTVPNPTPRADTPTCLHAVQPLRPLARPRIHRPPRSLRIPRTKRIAWPQMKRDETQGTSRTPNRPPRYCCTIFKASRPRSPMRLSAYPRHLRPRNWIPNTKFPQVLGPVAEAQTKLARRTEGRRRERNEVETSKNSFAF